MASTYENDLRLQEIGTGEQSGTWGTTTNTNLELIGEALSYSATGEAIANASTHTITVADGVADEARCFYLKCTGGGQACTVTLAPNSLSKVWVIENTTSYTLTFSQGSGANVAILAGQVKMIATDGAGSGAAIYDLMQDLAVPDLFVDDDLTLQSDAAVLGFGADKDTTLTHVADTGLLLNSTRQLQFGDSGTYIHQSADGVLDLVSDTEIEINATTIDINGAVDVSGTYTGGGLMTTGGNIVIPDAGNIGSASDTNAIAIGADGDVTLTQDLELQHDAATLSFGADNDVILTHVADTGLLLNSTMQLQFNDASQYINAPSATVLDINATDEIELNATLIDVNGNLDVSGTSQLTGVVTFTATPVFSSDITIEDDLFLDSDAAVIHLGEDGDVTLTHVADTGILLNSTMQLQFNDASQYINAPSATVLDINATDEVELNATLVDINANLEVSGTAAITGIATFTDDIIIGDGKTIGSASDVDAMTIASNGQVTFTQTLIGTALDISGDIDVDGTTNLDVTNIVGDLTATSDTITFQSANSTDPVLILKNTTNDGTSSRLHFVKDGGRNGANGDDLAEIDFIGDDAGQNQTTFGRIEALIASAADGSEGGKIRMRVATHDGEMQTGFEIIDGSAEDEIDVNIGFGDASNTTVSGKLLTADGGAGLPSHSFSGDTNTGMFSSAADTLQFSTGGTEAARITSDGQVLIGATASQSVTLSNGNALQIQGLGSNTSGISTTRHSNDSGGPYFNFGKSRGTADGAVTVVANNDILGQIFFSGADGTDILTPAASIQALVDGTPGGNDMPGRLVFSTTADGASAATERLTIDSSGNATFAGNIIGSDELQLLQPNGTNNFGMELNNSQQIKYKARGSSGTHIFTNTTSDTERFRISSDGSLSTNTAGTSNVRFGVSAGVGILSGGNYNVVIGDGAGEFLTTGDNSVFVGFEAGKGITGTKLTGGDNVGVGYRAGYLLQGTATRNTIVGYTAADALTTGDQNTVMGYDALGAGIASYYNTAFGTGALRADTTGRNSVAVGISALYSQNTTGSADMHNTAVGSGAGFNVTTGYQSTYIGGLAGYFATTADTTTFVGFKAGQGIDGAKLTGNNNVAVGANAGLLLQGTAHSNTLIGANAGDSLTTSTTNTAVGFEALSTASNFGENTAIGVRSQKASSSGHSNTSLGHESFLSLTGGTLNVAVGHDAGMFLTTASNSTFVGHNAGKGITGAKLTGTSNTAIGKDAGLLLQGAAGDNTVVGALSGDAITTGTRTVALGFKAGSGITTGDSNVAIGWQALLTEDAHSNNVAVGASALQTQNAGAHAYNVAVGFEAGKIITDGANNTFVGGLAGDGTDDGAKNVAVGTSSLSANCGDKNTAVGYAAGFATTGADNTVVGHEAGKGLLGGTGNTLIGSSAGDAITTGDSNVQLGYLTAASAVDVDAEIVIGPGVTGSGGSTVTIGSGAGKISNTFTSNATWAQSSDSRLKTNIQADTLGLSFINRLNPVTYKWKPSNDIDKSLPYYKEVNERDTSITMHGLVAQEVKTALDAEGVDTFAGWGEGLDGVQTISREMFVSPLVKAVQELSTKLDAALARIATLEG